MTRQSTANVHELVKDGFRLHREGDLVGAQSCLEAALRIEPEYPEALHMLGLVLHQQGAHLEASRHIARAVELVPGHPVLLNNLGDVLRSAGRPRLAVGHLLEAVRLRPGYAGALLNLAAAYNDLKDYDLGLHYARLAIEHAPQMAEAYFNLGLALLARVDLPGAIDAFRSALRLRPDHTIARSNLLYLLNLLPGAEPEQVAAEHRALMKPLDDLANPPSADALAGKQRRLRLGYVSRDFCAHAVNFFFEPVLSHHDDSRYEIYCYFDGEKVDQVTQRLQQAAHFWRSTSGWSNQALEDQIRLDGVDVLVDLAGHTEKNRLEVFARKPAPLQVTWLGYANTTGLTAMDYRIVDRVTAPEGEPFPGTEAALRLPGPFACFRAPAFAPGISPLPALANGHVTFGSLHKLEKINPQVISLWSRLLQANPDSRLLIARDQLDEWQQQRISREFAAHGVEPMQLQLRELNVPGQSFLEVFAGIDILLDVAPWSGHTLACCALWMGVPVVSWSGNSHASRMVASVLGVAGLEGLVARTEEKYLEIATNLAADKQALARLRAGLRGRVSATALCDEAGYTRQFEAAIEQAWENLCVH
ncbi:MAG TPA: tetratricopeptide repeat protein [Xanthomonadales bacterium]|nr:tetratricopeptide repeat protein [Xanthomonadales bacterium]